MTDLNAFIAQRQKQEPLPSKYSKHRLGSWTREMNPAASYYEKDYTHTFHTTNTSPITITIKESPITLGTRVWDCSIILGQYLFSLPPTTFTSSNVLELGAGTGIDAILLAKMGAVVCATEYTPTICEWLKTNCDYNEVSTQTLQPSKVMVTPLDWYNQHQIDEHIHIHYSHVIMSDCTLTVDDAIACLKVLNIFVGSRAGTVGYVGVCVERDGSPTFFSSLFSKENRFSVEELEGGQDGYGFGPEGARYRLFKLTCKNSQLD